MLTQELEKYKGQVVTEAERRLHAETGFIQTQEIVRQLQSVAQNNAVEANFYKSSLSRLMEGINIVLPIIEDLKTDIHSGPNLLCQMNCIQAENPS